MPGPSWWRQPDNRLRRCDERRSDSCSDETDGCCAVIPCTYCLEWLVYGEDPQYGTATFATDGWYGTIAGAEFIGFWRRDYDTGECQFAVTLDGEEIYAQTCYEGQSCRDSSDSATATIGYISGTLSWTKLESRPLPYVEDGETGCRTWFCGDCECTCRCLCVTITDGYTSEVCYGEICDTAYSDCEGPVWAGSVSCAGTDYDLSFALGQNSYGDCVITPTVNGVQQEPVDLTTCTAINITVTLDDGTTITVECKTCCCNCDTGACVGCCFCVTEPATSVDYVIDAPNCAALDGATGNISGPDVVADTDCGSCAALVNSSGFHEIPTHVWDDSIPDNGCVPQLGANFQFRFILRCDTNRPSSETDPNTTDPCCRNVRLVVVEAGIEQEKLEIPPLSCSCDPVTGLTAIFSLEQLLPECETFYVGGVCDGKPTCVQLGDGPGGACSLAGATLTITQAC